MKLKALYFLIFLIPFKISYAQRIDSLSLYSKAFSEQRTVYIHLPKFYEYKSDSVKLPVIYLLDGQHQWFVNPILSSIKYLQYTHEIPNAIVVVIPHQDRISECGVDDLETKLPLDIFITDELHDELNNYHISDIRIIIGHSYSASFALYSFYKHPAYYSAVIANTPLDKMEMLVRGFLENNWKNERQIYLSFGGIAEEKDHYHRKNYNQLKEKYPTFFDSISVIEADFSAHNAVPIISTPGLLTEFFVNFRGRYSGTARVDAEYRLLQIPDIPEVEVERVMNLSKIDDKFYPPEIPDINGIASRFSYSGYDKHAAEFYKLGIAYYPNYYEFYLSLYELTLTTDRIKAQQYLSKAESLLNTVEDDWEGKLTTLEEINAEKIKNGWQ